MGWLQVIQKRYTFPRSCRLGGQPAFAAVYAAKARETRGPLVLNLMPNGLSHSRLGLSVGRVVGVAVVRNRIKRLLREAFRLMQADLPVGYDWVIVVRKHEPLMLAEYQKLLVHLSLKLHNLWQKRPADGKNVLAEDTGQPAHRAPSGRRGKGKAKPDEAHGNS